MAGLPPPGNPDAISQYLHWLTLPPSEWHQFPSCIQMQAFLEHMQVVNDCAERAVKDVGEFAHMTRAPGDRDNVILVASDHRGRVPQMKKAAYHNVCSYICL